MQSFLLKKEINGKNLLPCYFFYGNELYLVHQFIEELKQALIPPEARDYCLEKFNLEENTWQEVIDSARTVSIFFASWRIIQVEIDPTKGNELSSSEKRLIKDWLHSNASQTTLVVVYPEKLAKNSSLLNFFQSFSPSKVFLKELKPLKEKELQAWMDKKFESLGKNITSEARMKLLELVGNELRKIDNELEKLATFVGTKKIIELDDVYQVLGWTKSHLEWEFIDSLEKADLDKSLLILNSFFREEAKPEFILNSIAKFFKEILLAKLWLKERSKEKKDIFKLLRPQIKEEYGTFYAHKFKRFFALVESFSLKDLNFLFEKLEAVDIKIKTSDLSARNLLENFLFDYCKFWRKE